MCIRDRVKDAESKADEDKTKKDLINERNSLDQLIYSTEKAINENSDKIDDNEKKDIDSALEKAKEVVKSDSIEDIKSASDELTKVSHKLAEKMYAEASKAQEDQATNEEEDSKEKKDEKEEVIDAEFTDK